jgi:hypothetical protein
MIFRHRESIGKRGFKPLALRNLANASFFWCIAHTVRRSLLSTISFPFNLALQWGQTAIHQIIDFYTNYH